MPKSAPCAPDIFSDPLVPIQQAAIARQQAYDALVAALAIRDAVPETATDALSAAYEAATAAFVNALVAWSVSKSSR
ncbi:MAG: hypothetical protein KDA99_22445 [Planctomycetales bacterium]|nr:hypothetical protein [Planctomycetales bacterium]